MSYTALYRKFRPQRFEDVKGQEHIVTTLKNQMNAQRIGHAYLFCGTRGTGKTSVAKIFAKAVNCEHPIDGSPCGECPTCKSIAAGTSMNVIEIDAASNNGVDNIREIREEVTYRPTEGKYKVYIIDEVHMLSTGAFNALLKTLEEPPEYVIFILATTEVHKIPITILSRCQRYDFHRISIDTICGYLHSVLEEEQITAEEKALRYVAKAGDGSMRDSLSLLDQCIAFYLGQTLTYDKVLEVLGAVDTQTYARLFHAIQKEDVIQAIQIVEEIVIEGRELLQFVSGFIWYFRNLLLAKSADDVYDILDVSKENVDILKEEASQVDALVFMRYIRNFSELQNQMKYSSQKRILLEIAIIKLCKPQMQQTQEAIEERIQKLEHKIEEKMTYVPSSNATNNQPVAQPQNTTQKPKVMPKAIPEDVAAVVRSWTSILQDLSGLMRTYLKTARLSLGGENVLLIVTQDVMAAEFLNVKEHIEEIEQTIAMHVEKEVKIQVQLNQTNQAFEDSYVDLEKLIPMDIEIEESEEEF